MFDCFVSSCRYNSGDGNCQNPYGPTITEDTLTAAGFLPMCRDYEEREGGGEMAECEYCHEDSEGYVKPLEKNCHAYLDTRCVNAPKLVIGFGRAIRICNIRYCPMCGRMLTDG